MAVDQRRGNAPQESGPLAVLPRQDAPVVRTPEAAAMALERVVTMGDLASLQPEERVAYYLDTCQSLGLNPRSRPFDWLLLDDRVVLYPNKSCADQLRSIHRIRIEVTIPEASKDGSMLRCTAKGFMPDGRYDESSKYVPLTGRRRDGTTYRLSGKDLANAYMKAETGAKRRVTFSLIGMANPPQDLDDVQYKVLTVDGRGNILDNPTPEQRMLAANPAVARVIGEATFEDATGQRTVFDGAPDQRPAPVAEPARRDGPSPTFRCDKARWSRVWATLPNNVLLNDQEARRRYIANYTSTWPVAARTDSLSRLLGVVTDAQAQRFMDDAREWLAERAAAVSADPDGEMEGSEGLTAEQADDEAAFQRGDRAGGYGELFPDDEVPAGPPKMTAEGHAAAVLTGAPLTPASRREEEATSPEPLDPTRQYGRAELFELYDAWAARMKSLDVMWRADDVKRLPDQALREAIEGVVSQVADLEEMLSRYDDGDEGQAD